MNNKTNKRNSGPNGKHWRRWAVWLATGLVIAFLVWLWMRPQPVEAEVVVAVRGPMQVTVDNLGQVRAADRYAIAAPIGAEVQRIDLREGDRVSKGQVLATLNLQPLDERQRQEAQARLQAAQARSREAAVQISRAQTQLGVAESELNRTEQLIASRFIAPQAADRARAAAATARAELAAARSREQAALAEVKVAQAALLASGSGSANQRRPLQLDAPVDGYVLRIPERSARSVPAGTVLMTVGDPSRFEIVVDVLSADAVKIAPGNPVLLENWGGSKTLRAQVRLIEPVAFTKISALGVEEQRVNVIADPVDPLGALGDGYRVEARIVIWATDETLKVPGSSLFRVGPAWHVFIVEDGRARQVEVKVGQRNRDEAQILDGLDQGAMVVRYPGNALTDGSRVQPRQ